MNVAIHDGSVFGVTRGGARDTDAGTELGCVSDAEPRTEFDKVEYETVDCLAHAQKDRCFVDVAHVEESAR